MNLILLILNYWLEDLFFFYKGKNGITEHAQMEQDTDIQIWFSMMEADFFVIFSELLYILV